MAGVAVFGAAGRVGWAVSAEALLAGLAEAGVPRLLLVGEAVAADLPDLPALSGADLAVAVLDEIERPRHHRTRVAIAGVA